MFDPIASFLGKTISFFYELIPNLGVAIILLTIAVNLVLFPLTLKQTRSMRAMQELQPELKELQRELKHDKQALQQATMELYRERGINPLAGCLPMILQLPIWFALFSALRSFSSAFVSPEPGVSAAGPLKFVLRDSRLFDDIATWGNALDAGEPASGAWKDFLWMDLGNSASDAFSTGFMTALPYLITILIVMGTTYWQTIQTQKRTKNDDQGQEKQPQQQAGQAMMKIMPFFMGLISFNLPGGLPVYFGAANLFRIGQQALIIRLDERKAAAAGDVPEKSAPARKPAPKPNPPARKQPSGGSGTTPRPQQRGPQGSKKRGKKRKRK
jgi:YidC/Oxa1 family membrane protein insertase